MNNEKLWGNPNTQQAIGDVIWVARPRRTPSDEQGKPPSQNVTARKRSKFSGVKKMPVENSVKRRNRFAH